MADGPKVPPPSLTTVRPGADPALSSVGGPKFGPAPKRYSLGLQDEIVRRIRLGERPDAACGAAGIPRETYHQWMRRGREGEPNFHPDCWAFRSAVLRAEDEAESGAVGALRDEDTGKFKTSEDAKFWLKTRRSRDWSEKTIIEVHNLMDQFLEKCEQHLTEAEYVKVLQIAASLTGDQAMPPIQLGPATIVEH